MMALKVGRGELKIEPMGKCVAIVVHEIVV